MKSEAGAGLVSTQCSVKQRKGTVMAMTIWSRREPPVARLCILSTLRRSSVCEAVMAVTEMQWL